MLERSFMFISYGMGGFFVGMGLYLLVTGSELPVTQGIPTPILGGLMSVYGAFRIYKAERIRRKLQKPGNNP
jgi:hypothetical protein